MIVRKRELQRIEREVDIGAILVSPRRGIALYHLHGIFRELARRMLAADRRPTAIVAASDTQALGVITAARDLGLRVPDDLSIVGYDDIEAADYVGLTTVRQQLFESGRRGAEILLAEIDARSEPPPVAYLAPELVVRATTAPPKGGR